MWGNTAGVQSGQVRDTGKEFQQEKKITTQIEKKKTYLAECWQVM